MRAESRLPAGANRYLLILPMPTPNGRLHLGHIAGPYLKLDVVARHLRMQGHLVSVLTGVDSFESYVTLRAYQEGRTSREIASNYRLAITRDLEAMGIQCDVVTDAAEGPFAQSYAAVNGSMVDRYVHRGSTRIIQERIPWAAGTNEPVVGCWLQGRCPRCGGELAGFYCEECGGHVQPEELVQPVDRLGRKLHWRTVESLFLEKVHLGRVRESIEQSCADPVFRSIAWRHLDLNGARTRLTVPGSWGVPWKVGANRLPNVLFSYASVFGYAVALGERYRAWEGIPLNPFAIESEVRTVLSFGVDNTVALLGGTTVMAVAHGELKPFSHCLTNHFYELENAKFSTSRGHAIWAADATDALPHGRDALRYYLAKTHPRLSSERFFPEAFLEVVNQHVIREIYGRARDAHRRASRLKTFEVHNGIQRAFAHVNATQSERLHPSQGDISGAVDVIDAWIQVGRDLEAGSGCPRSDASADYGWLKGLALLAFPLMPDFASTLWTALGHTGEPRTTLFADQPPLRLLNDACWPQAFEKHQLARCLPPELRSA